jgi:ABC-2 type transport system permease protein
MMANNALILFIFVLWFTVFPKIGNMNGIEAYVPLYVIHLIIFGIAHIFFWWYSEIASMIKEGKLDASLLTPWHPLLKILPSKMEYSAFGDFFSGFIFLAYFTPHLFFDAWFMGRLLLVSLIGTASWLGIMIFYHSLGFFISSAEQIAEGALHGIIWWGLYPPESYGTSPLRFALLTLFPVFWIVFYPYEFTLHPNLGLLLQIGAASLIFLSLAVYTFNRWLRKYESGNRIQNNT